MARGNQRGPRPYNDPDYRAAKLQLKLEHINCRCPGCPKCTSPHGCTRRATQPDHTPALHAHQHRRGTGCCHLRPLCAPCNLSRGATEGNIKREPHTERW